MLPSLTLKYVSCDDAVVVVRSGQVEHRRAALQRRRDGRGIADVAQ
jgi:hypothetical protein